MDYFAAASNSSSDGSLSNSSSVTKNNGRAKEKKKITKGKGAVRLSTDPQSVAARERRHRISDRFKILQSLVPGGTKMDTVSMLEEAIHYVKFLKTQIWLHQSMISLVDDDDHLDPSFLPPHHHLHHPTGCLDHLPNQQIHDLYGHNNFLSAGSLQQPSPATNIPLVDYNYFQGQETMPNNMEAYMKYYS